MIQKWALEGTSRTRLGGLVCLACPGRSVLLVHFIREFWVSDGLAGSNRCPPSCPLSDSMLQPSWDPLPKPTVPPSAHTSRPGLQGSTELPPTIPFLKLFPSLRDEKKRKCLTPRQTPSSVKCSPSPPLLFKTRGSGRKTRQPRFIIQIASCSANRFGSFLLKLQRCCPDGLC